MKMITSALDIPGHSHEVDPVVQFILDQSSWSSRRVTQIDPYHLCVPYIRRKSYRGQDEGDTDVTQKPSLDANLYTSSVEDSCRSLDCQK